MFENAESIGAPRSVCHIAGACVLLMIYGRSSVLIICICMCIPYMSSVIERIYIYTPGVSFSIGEAAPHHVIYDCISGECAVPGLNANFCFLWSTNCVLLFDISLILGCL